MTVQLRLSLLSFLILQFYTIQSENDDIVIGIDIGTTYSSVGAIINDNIQIIPNLLGNFKTPNYVSFTDSKILVGESAMNNIINNPQNTIFNMLRLIGVKYSDKMIEKFNKLYAFKIVNDENNKAYLEVNYKNETRLFAPEQILAILFKYMKQIVEKYLNQNITKCVITVANDFYHLQRISLKVSAEMAGLDVLSMINSASAVALAYRYNKYNLSEENIIVYDIGGGMLDTSLISIDEGIIEVLATNGEQYLGGEDFNNNLIEHFIQLLENKYKIDITTNKLAILKLRNEIEIAKRKLSTETEVKLDIENIIDRISLNETLTRDLFEELNNDLFNKQIKLLDEMFKDNQSHKSEIDQVILVGGTSNIPKIQQIIKKYFDNKEILKLVNKNYPATIGACIKAAIMSDYYTKTNKCVKDIFLLDVTSHSITIKTENGEFDTIINKNWIIPIKMHRTLTTTKDNQNKIIFHVYQSDNNKLLGIYQIGGIQPSPAPKGVAKLETSFQIDRNGILNVFAVNKQETYINTITITIYDSRLTNEEINKMSQIFNNFSSYFEFN